MRLLSEMIKIYILTILVLEYFLRNKTISPFNSNLKEVSE